MLSNINSKLSSSLRQAIHIRHVRSFTSTNVLDKYDIVVLGTFSQYLFGFVPITAY